MGLMAHSLATPTKLVSAGGYLDITLDFLFYAAIPLGFILANPEQNAIAGAILLATFLGSGSSFLAFAIAAEKLNLDKPQFKYKSFYYLNGLTEGTETIAIFLADFVCGRSILLYSLAFLRLLVPSLFSPAFMVATTLSEKTRSGYSQELNIVIYLKGFKGNKYINKRVNQ